MGWRLNVPSGIKRAEEVGEIPAAGGTVVEENNLEQEVPEVGLWDDILDDSEDLGDAEDVQPEGADEGEKAEEVVKTPEAEEAPEEEPVVPPAEPAPVVEPEQPTTEEQPAQVQTPEQAQAMQEEIGVARGKVLDTLSTMYALTEEESETLQLEPEKVLPRLAAQLHLNITEALQAGIESQLPQMMQQATIAEQTKEKSVNAFYDAWPDLKGDDKEATVLRVMKSYRSTNPTATTEQIIREGGVMAMMALQLPIGAVGEQPAAVAPVRSDRPVQPAMPGASTVPVRSQSDNAFSQMFLDAIEEDI